MSLSAFGTLPPGVLTTPVPFALDVSHHDQNHLKRLVHDANIGPPSYYTAHTDTTSTTSFGLSRDWLITAQDVWTSHGQSYSWHDEQTRLNSLPNFRINITTSTPAADPNEQAEEQTFNLHFAALFSQSPTATPLILLHGWPGAWFEFAPLLELLATKYTPETLPYHVVVPSIPDYGLSTRSRELERELSMDEAAAALDELMVQLGFGTGGYVAQGGDIGSFLAQVMCATFDACRAFHLNLFFLTEAQTAAVAGIPVTPAEQVQVDRAADWSVKGTSYGNEHGTRPATISLVLSTNPLAMLAWMGEKFIEWSDNRYPIGLNTILSMTSFYWFTESYGRAMWAYRTLMGVIGGSFPTLPFSTTKPFGYSAYHVELGVLPKSWAEHLFSNLAFHKSHDKGGHYAALEQPELFLEDLEEFMVIVAGATGSN